MVFFCERDFVAEVLRLDEVVVVAGEGESSSESMGAGVEDLRLRCRLVDERGECECSLSVSESAVEVVGLCVEAEMSWDMGVSCSFCEEAANEDGE